MAAILEFLSSYLDSRAQQHREAEAAQAQQAPASAFAAAWNTAGGPEPLRTTVQDPVRGPMTYYPACDAAASDDGLLYLTLTVQPDGPVSTDTIAANAEAVRQAVRAFFQVAVRQVGLDVRRFSVSLAYEPVRPLLNGDGAALVGYSSGRGRPIYLPLIGEVTAVTGDDCDAALSWIGAAYSMVEQRGSDPDSAVSSTDAVARQARHGAVPAPQLLALGDAVCSENESSTRIGAKTLALARRGLIESSLADVEPDRWAVRPSLTIRCDGDTCIVEKAGRSLRFTPAWRY